MRELPGAGGSGSSRVRAPGAAWPRAFAKRPDSPGYTSSRRRIAELAAVRKTNTARSGQPVPSHSVRAELVDLARVEILQCHLAQNRNHVRLDVIAIVLVGGRCDAAIALIVSEELL